MTELYIQNYLRAGNTPVSLSERHVKHRRHEKYPNLVLFKYDIFATFFLDPLVQGSRGIVVLDETNDWAVVARGFDKFFNDTEDHASTIDWNTAETPLVDELWEMFNPYKGVFWDGYILEKVASGWKLLNIESLDVETDIGVKYFWRRIV